MVGWDNKPVSKMAKLTDNASAQCLLTEASRNVFLDTVKLVFAIMVNPAHKSAMKLVMDLPPALANL